MPSTQSQSSHSYNCCQTEVAGLRALRRHQLSIFSLCPSHASVSPSNLKGALKLLSTSMSKYGRRPLLLSLLALTHARLEQRQEAFATCEEVAASRPTDTHILNTLSLVYRHLDFPHLVPPLYEHALAALPTSQTAHPTEELLLPLFYAYAAQHEYEQAQRTAMKLYTHYKQTHYLYYSATTQLLRVSLPSLLDPPAAAPNKLLQISYAMVKRAAPALSLRPDDVELLVVLLWRSGEDEKAGELLEGDEGRLYGAVYEEEWLRMRAEAWRRRGKRRKERDTWEELMCKYEADWEYVTRWMQAHMDRLDMKQEENAGEEEDSLSEEERVAHMRAVIEELKADETNTAGRKRNPHLSSVHLSHLLLSRSLASSTPQSPMPDDAYTPLLDDLISYYTLYGSRSCFFPDVQSYLLSLPPSQRLVLLERMRQACGEDCRPGEQLGGDSKALQQRMGLLISYHQCSRALEMHLGLSEQQLVELALLFYRHYLLCSSHFSSPVSTARGMGEPFLQLFCSIVYDLYRLTSQPSYLFTAVVLLEHSLSFSPHNFDHVLLLMRLYCHPALACISRAHELYTMLSIKQVQCESLSHLILHDTLRLSSFAHSSILLSQLQLFHTQYDREESQVLQLAYEQRRWVRVLECCEMRERMGRSWGRRWAAEEKRWVDVMRADSKQLADVATLLAKQEEERANEGEVRKTDVVVNSDYSVVVSYEPPTSSLPFLLNRPAASLLPSFTRLQSPVPVRADSSYSIDSEYLLSYRYKQLLPRLLVAAVQHDAVAMRQLLSVLRDVLVELGVLRAPTVTELAAPLNGVNGTVGRSFDERQWTLLFLTLEISACITEVRPHTEALLNTFTSPPPTASSSADPQSTANGQHHDHTLRWSSISRQLSVLIDMLTSLQPHLSMEAIQHPADDKHTVLEGSPRPRPFDPSTLTHISLFLQHSGFALCCLLQLWTAAIPGRKAAKAKKKKATTGRGGNAPAAAEESEEERAVWAVLVAARLTLAQLIRTYQTTLEGVSALLSSLSGVEVSHSPAFPLLQQCAELVEAVKADEVAAASDSTDGSTVNGSGGTGVRGSVDVDSEVSKCVARLMAGWLSSSEELSKLANTYAAVMQHIKLPETK